LSIAPGQALSPRGPRSAASALAVPSGHNPQRHLRPNQLLQDFRGTVPSPPQAHDGLSVTPVNTPRACQSACLPGALVSKASARTARIAKHGKRIVDDCPPLWGILTGSRIVDQRDTVHHQSHRGRPIGLCSENAPREFLVILACRKSPWMAQSPAISSGLVPAYAQHPGKVPIPRPKSCKSCERAVQPSRAWGID